MTWIKLQDDLPDHPRAVKAGPEAMWLYVAGLCYCNRFTTDGVIPGVQVSRLTTVPKPTQAARALVETGLWEPSAEDYHVRNYLKFQRSSSEIEEISKRNAKAGALGAAAKAQRSVNAMPSETPSGAPSEATAKGSAKGSAKGKQRATESFKQIQSTEEETEKTLKASSLPAEDDSPSFEDFWEKYPRQPNGQKPERKQAKDQWSRLKPAQRISALASLPNYQKALLSSDWQSAKHAFRYLKDRSFEDYSAPPLEVAGGGWTPPTEEEIEAEARRLVAHVGL